MLKLVSRILFFFLCFSAQFVFAEIYPNGLSDGTLRVDNSKEIPVKIYANYRVDAIKDKLNQNLDENILVILSDNNTDVSSKEEFYYVSNFLNTQREKGFVLFDTKFNCFDTQVDESNLAAVKYIYKPKDSLSKVSKNSTLSLQTPEKIWDPNKGIKIGSFTLAYYSLMFVLAFVLGYVLMKKMFKIDHVDEKLLDPLLTWTLVGTILGARIGHVIFYEPELFKQDFLSVFLPIQTQPYFKFTGFSGLASHGATIALIFTTLYYSFKIIKKNPFWVYDRLVTVVALGGAFVRIGNFINSEIIGKPVAGDSPFAMLFVQQSGYGEIIPRYPSQLFEAIGYFFLFLLLWFFYKKTNKKLQQGWIFGLFFIVLWAIRFFVEFLKEPQGDEFITIGGLNTGQILSIPFIISGFIIMMYSKRNLEKTN